MISGRYSSAAVPPGRAGPANRAEKGHPEFRVIGRQRGRVAATTGRDERAEVGDPVALSGLHQVRSAGGGVALAQPPVARAHFADAAPLSSSSTTRGPTSGSATRTPVTGQNSRSTAAPRRQQHRYVETSTCASNHARTALGSYRRWRPMRRAGGPNPFRRH
jgi:hypothetical protein